MDEVFTSKIPPVFYIFNVRQKEYSILLRCHEKCITVDIVDFLDENCMYIDLVIITSY